MKTVLIVDDEKNVRASLASTFKLEGYGVEMAEDGARAVQAADRGGIDLVVLDLQMPDIDGLETLRRLRATGYEQPVIFLSAHGTIEKAVEACQRFGRPFHNGESRSGFSLRSGP